MEHHISGDAIKTQIAGPDPSNCRVEPENLHFNKSPGAGERKKLGDHPWKSIIHSVSMTWPPPLWNAEDMPLTLPCGKVSDKTLSISYIKSICTSIVGRHF